MFRRLLPYQLGVDVGLAAICVGLRLSVGVPDAALVVVVAGMGLALALRRISPVLALTVAWVFAIVQMAALLPPDVANLAVLPVLYSSARYGGRALKWTGLASAVVGAVAVSTYLTASAYLVGLFGEAFAPSVQRVAVTFGLYFVAAAAGLVLSWTLGLLAKTWSTARESRMRQVMAEHDVAVEQQRTRIARDMHDVVAHSLAVVIAQADGARYAMAADPAAAESALSTISATARSALADVRVLLGELRHDEPTAPQPTLADLSRLFEQVGASGLSVRFHESGSPAALAPGSQLAVYRIVQEALTNALRHGDPAAGATVRLTWHPRELGVRVENRVTAGERSGSAPGHGVAGMRERASLVGGTLATAEQAGKFVVSATIPSPSSTSAAAAETGEAATAVTTTTPPSTPTAAA
jgi:signal transduction histidine kinase